MNKLFYFRVKKQKLKNPSQEKTFMETLIYNAIQFNLKIKIILDA